MSTKEILLGIKRLPFNERLTVIEKALKSLHNSTDMQLEKAAKTLMADYKKDKNLIAFTALDTENFMKRGDIWLVNLDLTIGSEIKKTRPGVIVNADAVGKLPLKVIVPITDWKNHYSIAPWMVKIIPNLQNGLSKISSADCFQVRSVSEIRLSKKIGNIGKNEMDEIIKGLSSILQIG